MVLRSRLTIWAASGSRAESLQPLAAEFNSTLSWMASDTALRSSALLRKPTFVERASGSKRSSSRSIKARSASRKNFPTTDTCGSVTGTSRVRLCNEVFDEYLAHCEARLSRGDMSAATVRGYRKVLSGVWRPRIGELVFYSVRYSHLVAIADKQKWSKKTYNNGISVLRRAFDFGYRDRPLEENPARCLRGARLRKSDRPKVDPFCMHDAETFIAAIHRDWGEAQGNYDEFRFFTGLRPSEQIALVALGSRSHQWDRQRQQSASVWRGSMHDKDRRGSAHRALSARARGSEKTYPLS